MTFSLDELKDSVTTGQRFIARFSRSYLLCKIRWVSMRRDSYTADLLGWFNIGHSEFIMPVAFVGLVVAADGKLVAYTERRDSQERVEYNNNDGLFGPIVMIPEHVINEDAMDFGK